MKFVLYDIFSITVTLCIAMVFSSMALELFMAKKKWVAIFRSLAGLFMILSFFLIISFTVNKSIMNVKSGEPITSTSVIYFICQAILIASFSYLTFWSLRNTIRKFTDQKEG